MARGRGIGHEVLVCYVKGTKLSFLRILQAFKIVMYLSGNILKFCNVSGSSKLATISNFESLLGVVFITIY